METKKLIVALVFSVTSLLAVVLLLYAVKDVNKAQGLTQLQINQVHEIVRTALATPTPTLSPTATPSATPTLRVSSPNQVRRGATPLIIKP